jgi:hypothetical protein
MLFGGMLTANSFACVNFLSSGKLTSLLISYSSGSWKSLWSQSGQVISLLAMSVIGSAIVFQKGRVWGAPKCQSKI